MFPVHLQKALFAGLGLLSLLIVLVIYPNVSTADQFGSSDGLVKICLLQNVSQVAFILEGQYSIIDTATGRSVTNNQQGGRWTIEKINGSLQVSLDGRLIGLYQGPLRAAPVGEAHYMQAGDGTVLPAGHGSEPPAVMGSNGEISYLSDNGQGYYIINDQGIAGVMQQSGLNLIKLEKGGRLISYRGDLEIKTAGTGIDVINVLPVEQYLYGVVPAEMPASFPTEALKAQAVIARSYILNQMGASNASGFDVVDNQLDQVYGGYDQENNVTSRAVDETKGMVLVHQGQLVEAYYHSSSGGYTENSEDVWLSALPYLKAQHDPADSNGQHYHWQVDYTVSQLTELINSQLKKNPSPGWETDFSLVNDLRILEYTASGQRIKRMLIEGISISGQPQFVTVSNADRVRVVLGLKSALFVLQKELGNDGALRSVSFVGNGWGHGLGLSQWGARGLADRGYSFQQILQYYYSGVDLVGN